MIRLEIYVRKIMSLRLRNVFCRTANIIVIAGFNTKEADAVISHNGNNIGFALGQAL